MSLHFYSRVRETTSRNSCKKKGGNTVFIQLLGANWHAVIFVALERAEVIHFDDNRIGTGKGLSVHVTSDRQSPARSTCPGADPVVCAVEVLGDCGIEVGIEGTAGDRISETISIPARGELIGGQVR